MIPHFFEAELGISGTWTLLIAGVTLILNLVMFPDGVAGSQYQKQKAEAVAKRAEPRGTRHRRWRRPPPAAEAMHERACSQHAGLSVRFGGVHALSDVDLEGARRASSSG